jgi:hypothetical protein
MAFISQPSVSFLLLTYQTLKDWGIGKSHSFGKLQDRVEDRVSKKELQKKL